MAWHQINEPTLSSSLGTGLGQGLAALAQSKLAQIAQDRKTDIFRKVGYDDQTAHLLSTLHSADPASFHKILEMVGGGGQQGQQMGQQQPQQDQSQSQFMAGMQGGKSNLQYEKYKDKLLPELDYLNSMDRTVSEMLDYAKNKNVNFGALSSIASNIPIVGQKMLNTDTGYYDTLSNKFVTDAAQMAKGVRSVYHIKSIAAAKAGLGKTKAQNLKILNYYKDDIQNKKAAFFKAHPYMKDFENQQEQQQEQQGLMQDEQGNLFMNGRKLKLKGQ